MNKEQALRELIREAINETRTRYYENVPLRGGYNVFTDVTEQTYWRDLLGEALTKTDAIYTLESILTKPEEEK